MTRQNAHAVKVALGLADHTLAGLPHPGHCELTVSPDDRGRIRYARSVWRNHALREETIDNLIAQLDRWNP